MLLELDRVSVSYSRVRALREVSLGVAAGGIATIIGANGAGKSTTLRSISGLAPIRAGEIRFDGERIDRLPAHLVAARGIGHVPEGRRVFPELTVAENLRTGAFLRRDRGEVEADLERIYARFPRLAERRRQRAETLSGGEQQMLAIGRALMLRPRVLLLDEPSMGLAPIIVEEIFRILVDIRAAGTPIILVEQNADIALQLADHAYVLENGAVALAGPAGELRGHEHVKRAYLGA